MICPKMMIPFAGNKMWKLSGAQPRFLFGRDQSMTSSWVRLFLPFIF